jgi:CubicO group peptidase (beta-lactamase class C family)
MTSKLSAENSRKLDTLASKTMGRANVPAVSISLLRDGNVIYSRGYGTTCREENRPATPDTLYGIGSCTKSFISLAIMKLAEQDKLDPWDPVKEYLPEFDLGREGKPITLHHLMSHSSGISSLGTANILIEQMSAGGHPIPLSSRDDFMSFVNSAVEEVDAAPGEKYYYFNAGYTLLGYVIEKVSGIGLPEFIQSQILKPLDMEKTTFKRGEVEGEPDVMTAYWREKDGELTPTIHPYHELIYAPGGLLSNTRELTNYLQMYLNRGEYKGKRIIGEGMLDRIVERHIERPRNLFGKNHYGYGWGIMDFLGERLIVHTGSTGVSSAFLGYIPERNIGVAYLSNTGYWSSTIPHGGLALLMDKDPTIEIPYLHGDNHREKLAGEYTSYRDVLRINIVKKGNLLYSETKSKWAETSQPLIPVSDDLEENRYWLYQGESGKSQVEFILEDGATKLYWDRWVLHKQP